MKRETKALIKQVITPEIAKQLVKTDFNDFMNKFIKSLGYNEENLAKEPFSGLAKLTKEEIEALLGDSDDMSDSYGFEDDTLDSDETARFELGIEFCDTGCNCTCCITNSETGDDSSDDYLDDYDAFDEDDFDEDDFDEDDFDEYEDDFEESEEDELFDSENGYDTLVNKKITRKKYRKATEEEMELNDELKPIYSEPFKGFGNGLLYLRDEADEYEIDFESTLSEEEKGLSEFERYLRRNWTPAMYELDMSNAMSMNSERRQAAINSLTTMYQSIHSLRETYLAYYGKLLSEADVHNMVHKSIENGFRFLGANSLLFSIYKENNDFRDNSTNTLDDYVKFTIRERESYFAGANFVDYLHFEDTKFFRDNPKRLLLAKALNTLRNKLNIGIINVTLHGYKEMKDVQELMHEIMKQDERFLSGFSPDYEIKHKMGLAVEIDLQLIASKGIEMIDNLFETCIDVDYDDAELMDVIDTVKYELESKIEIAQRLMFISRTLENSLLTLGQLEKGSGFLINPIAKTERMAHRTKVQEYILDFLKKELKKLKKYMKRYNEEFGKTFMIESINEINTRLRGCDASTDILANLMIVNQAILELMLEYGYNYQSWRFVSNKAANKTKKN